MEINTITKYTQLIKDKAEKEKLKTRWDKYKTACKMVDLNPAISAIT